MHNKSLKCSGKEHLNLILQETANFTWWKVLDKLTLFKIFFFYYQLYYYTAEMSIIAKCSLYWLLKCVFFFTTLYVVCCVIMCFIPWMHLREMLTHSMPQFVPRFLFLLSSHHRRDEKSFFAPPLLLYDSYSSVTCLSQWIQTCAGL